MEILISAFITLAVAMIGFAVDNYNATQQEEQAQKSLDLQKEISDTNFGLQQDQFEYQKQLNELQMKREDTAMQRQVADLKAAGLSPLMAGSGSSTGQLISASAPQRDGSGILSAMSNMLGVKTDYANRRAQVRQFAQQQTLQSAQTYADLQSKRLDNQYKREVINGQKIANAYNLEHGLRDPSWQNAIVDVIEGYMSKHGIDPTDDVSDNISKGKKLISDKVKDSLDGKIPDPIVDIIVDSIDSELPLPLAVGTEAGKAVKGYISENVDKAKNYVSGKASSIKEKTKQKYNKTKKWVYKNVFRYTHN